MTNLVLEASGSVKLGLVFKRRNPRLRGDSKLQPYRMLIWPTDVSSYILATSPWNYNTYNRDLNAAVNAG